MHAPPGWAPTTSRPRALRDTNACPGGRVAGRLSGGGGTPQNQPPGHGGQCAETAHLCPPWGRSMIKDRPLCHKDQPRGSTSSTTAGARDTPGGGAGSPPCPAPPGCPRQVSPCSHRGPVLPGGQLQAPVTGSQVPLGPHLHTWAQPGPERPGGQAVGWGEQRLLRALPPQDSPAHAHPVSLSVFPTRIQGTGGSPQYPTLTEATVRPQEARRAAAGARGWVTSCLVQTLTQLLAARPEAPRWACYRNGWWLMD